MSIGKDWASRESKDGLLRSLEINPIVIFELECECEFRVDQWAVIGRVIECEERLIGLSFPATKYFSRGLFITSISIGTLLISLVINLL